MLGKESGTSIENSALVAVDANIRRTTHTHETVNNQRRAEDKPQYGVISATNLAIYMRLAGEFMAKLPTRRVTSLETKLLVRMRLI